MNEWMNYTVGVVAEVVQEATDGPAGGDGESGDGHCETGGEWEIRGADDLISE